MKIGFIGCGNMAQAMIGGIVKGGVNGVDVLASNPSVEKLRLAEERYKIETTSDNRQVAKVADVLILAVKPRYYEQVIAEIKGDVKKETIVVSIALGYTTEMLEKVFGKKTKLVCAMPNTPSMVGEGMTAVCANSVATKEDVDLVCELFSSFSKTAIVDESLMASVVAVSGSSPAYVYMFIEAMADGAVKQGMARDLAYQFAAQAVLGSAKMVLETGIHPAQLKDNVCSPGGATIEAVRVLEEKGMRSAVMEAMTACAEKAKGN